MKAMTQPQGTAHAEHELTQLAARFQDWRYRRTTPRRVAADASLFSCVGYRPCGRRTICAYLMLFPSPHTTLTPPCAVCQDAPKLVAPASLVP